MLLLEKILHAKKLNYQTLIPLIKPYVSPKHIDLDGSDTVNIFIDFWDVIKPLYNPQTIDTLNNLKVDERFMISSEVINIAGHYRHFFFSRMKKYTNIIFFYSNTKDEFRTSINNDYKEVFYEKRLNQKHTTFGILNSIVQKNVNLIKLFCEYVPHVYFINTGTVEPSLIPHLFLSDKSRLNQNLIDKNSTSIIISNEKIHYQDLTLQDRVLQLELRGKEKSRFITSEDIINVLLEKSKKEYNLSILPDMYTLVLGLAGNTDYSVKGVKKMGNVKALNFIQKGIDQNVLKNIAYNNIDMLENLNSLLKEDELNKLKENILLLNNHMYKFNEKDLINIEMQMVDRIDAKSVRYVVDKYFNKYPILLDMVFEGEQYE
jgi:hypothetical protein